MHRLEASPPHELQVTSSHSRYVSCPLPVATKSPDVSTRLFRSHRGATMLVQKELAHTSAMPLQDDTSLLCSKIAGRTLCNTSRLMRNLGLRMLSICHALLTCQCSKASQVCDDVWSYKKDRNRLNAAERASDCTRPMPCDKYASSLLMYIASDLNPALQPRAH